MWSGVSIKAPGEMPLSAENMRDRLRIDSPSEDALLDGFILAAASEIEGPNGWGLALMHQVWTQTLDGFSSPIVLRGWPVTGIEQIRYTSPDGNEVILPAEDYRLVAGVEPAEIVPADGKRWPAVTSGRGVVQIDYTLGASDQNGVDKGLITAISLLVGHYYENREAVLTGTIVAELPLGVSHIRSRLARIPVVG